ncbi:MAG TPA: hypothetical protein EYF98_04835 [Planctomycetes bacterium]|nr:hypothetical protein [Planctomycetota bacterium]
MTMRTSISLALVLLSAPALSQGAGAPWDGLTLFQPNSSTTTYLIDNSGAVVHTWPGTYSPGNSVYLLDDQTLLRTTRAVMGPGATPAGIQLVAWDGSLLWDYHDADPNRTRHHDVERLPNGNILTVSWQHMTRPQAVQAGRDPASFSGMVFSPDSIIEIQPNGANGGTIVWEWHVIDHVIQDFDATRANFGVVGDHPELIDVNFPASVVQNGDWNHVNGIDYNADLDQIIISAHHLDEFWIIDHSTTTAEAASHAGGNSGRGGDLLYRWGNPESYRAGTPADKRLFGQHNTQWIADGSPGAGNILVFNNGNGRPAGDFSTVEEIVPPVDGQGAYALTPGSAYGPAAPLWSYQAPVPTSFYSSIISGAQRLPNGNTLVCSGTQEWFFEVTSSGSLVWEYNIPFTGTANNNTFRAERYQLCDAPASYCVSSPNSMGGGAQIGWSGSASHSANDLSLSVSGSSASMPGIFYFGNLQLQVAFGDGVRCVGGSVSRLPVVFSDAAGQVSYALDLANPLLSTSSIQSGETWEFQFWYRDPAFGGTGFNLSDALEVTFCN